MLRRNGAELNRREVLERAAERAEARADAGEEDYVFMGTLGFHGGSSALDRGISAEWRERGRARTLRRRYRDEAHGTQDRKSTRLNSSHSQISYAVFCLKKKKKQRKE